MSSLTEQQATYYRDPDTGHLMMPGTKRPDGTWRKPRRIKEGYVPQDEVPLYESKGKQWAKSRDQATGPPGLSAGILNMKIDTFDSRSLQPAYHIPGLSPDTPPVGSDVKSKNAKKKKNKNNNSNLMTSNNSAVNQQQQQQHQQQLQSLPPEPSVVIDPAKKLRNLRKKLRDIEALEARLENGEITKPEPEQLEKVARKEMVEEEIAQLEKLVGS